jgi:DsbC/DsbD-like thiol-disulfide interchange protein
MMPTDRLSATFGSTAALLLFFSVCLRAQPNPVKWSVMANPPVKVLNVSGKLRVEVVAQIYEGWHIYSLTQPEGRPFPTQITVPAGQPFKLAGSIQGPHPKTKFEEVFGINVEWYEDKVVFMLPVQVAAGAPAGKHKLLVDVRFQACSDRICLQPKTEKLELDLEVSGASSCSQDKPGARPPRKKPRR